ncbi:Phosphatidate phosphatase APP1 [Trametes pubescens]|uniref:Phosphatidate phosphatase APP1 n=1 Tax=Trametes pubescens TaxID=154538 RepID=A0A1M2VUE0_TRAPU|nr:Phosphatidate phosphatase APP1 [Trametes pubescens]
MSEDMPPSSWRSLASAAGRSLKGYVAQQRELKQSYPSWRGTPPQDSDATPKKQSWGQWAGQKLRRGSQSEYDVSGDRITIFPGWATRRYREPQRDGQDGVFDAINFLLSCAGSYGRADAQFDIDVFVSGYTCKLTGVGFNTKAGRAFLRLAKSYAALPKLSVGTGMSTAITPMSRSTEELLAHAHLPPPPDQITDESEMQALDDKLRRIEFDVRSVDSGRSGYDAPSLDYSSDSHSSRPPSASSASSTYSGSGPGYSRSSGSSPPASATPLGLGAGSSDLQRWHANLEARLHPFWSSALVNRTVRLSLYAADPTLYEDGATDESASSGSSGSPEKSPILTREVITAADGSFQVKFSVPWEQMCVHPGALHIAFGGPGLEQDLFVVAELLAPPSPGPGTPATPHGPTPRYMPRFPAPVTVSTSIAIPLSCSSVRVISDIDDTIKLSGILGGARAVFHNVFVKDLRDSVIRGMGDWYTGMWKRGVRFHYVSNGPFELLPIVNEFLQIARLPPGSIRLRSYGGRSLFNGLLSAPAMRKRTGVLDVLNHFPEAHFILVGDSGEQDLELYAELARERPDQVVGIFIRDAGVRGEDIRPIDDPTGAEAYRGGVDAAFGLSGSAPAGGGMRGAGRRMVGRYGPSRSMSDATPGASTSSKPPGRARSGSDVSTPSGGPSPTTEYFSSAPRTHSPITEEPSGTPPMGFKAEADRDVTPSSFPPQGFARLQGTLEWTDARARWQPQLPPPRQASSQSSQSSVSDAEKKRWELQVRLWRARAEVPPSIPIRIFREPEECVEAAGILDRLQVPISK